MDTYGSRTSAMDNTGSDDCVNNAVSQVTTGSVITTFILFAVMFTALLISEISIMIKQIKIGSNNIRRTII